MLNEYVLKRISGIIPTERLMRDEPMSRHTSFRIGGPAALFVQVNNEDELSAVLAALNEGQAEFIIAGNGSNLLVSDEGYPGVIVKLGGSFEDITADADNECIVTAGAAKLLSSVSAYLTERGLAGFEFASGIPGSVGGAVFMNAGAYGGEIKDVAKSVRLMDIAGGAAYDVTAEDMNFGYRMSRAQAGGLVILSVTLELKKDDPAAISERVLELAAKRNAKQPVNYPSAGSTFKRPVGGYAAALIEEAGLKGYRAGGACVSEKHAGFVINDGGASCEDVLSVMRHVRETVYEKSGIMLEPEVRLINCHL